MLIDLLLGLAQAETAASVPPGDTVVIVTARKREETLVAVPQSVTVFSAANLADRDIRTLGDIASRTPNLAAAYGNGATAIGDARTLEIRGVSGPGTTAVYIDDTPVPDSIDPRLLDIDHVEVLKGPQGTLYGEGSLGGSVKLVTTPPSLAHNTRKVMAEAGGTSSGGSLDADAAVAGNIVVRPDRLAVRYALFAGHDAGWLKRSYPGPMGTETVDDQGASSAWGVAFTARLQVNPRLETSLRLLFQRRDDYGFPAAFAPLPAFRPVGHLARDFDIQPKVSDRWFLPSLTFAYSGDGWRLDSSTSWFRRDLRETEDSSIGTAQFLEVIGTPLPAQPYAWQGRREREQVAHETRLAFGDSEGLSGVAGIFYSSGRDDFIIPSIQAAGLQAAGYWSDDLLWRSDIRESQQSAALFGEVYYPFLRHFTLTLGARQFWLSQTYHLYADGYLDGGLTDNPPGRNRESGLSPKLALSYRPSSSTEIYASAAKGFRAGGSGQAVIPQCDASLADIGLTASQAERYGSDTVWSYEVGAKRQLSHPGLLVTGALYHLGWKDIQQSVFLPSCAFIITANAGAAAADGGELEVAGQLTPDLKVRVGLGYEDARITEKGATAQAVGSRVYQVPRWTVSAAGDYTWPIGAGRTGFAGLDVAYVGDSLSNNGGDMELVRRGYGLVNLRLGLRNGPAEWSLNVHNLTDTRVNLGDIGYLGYRQYAGDLPLPQVVTLPPLSVRLQFRRSY